MTADALLLRRPLLSTDGAFRGYRFKSSLNGSVQPFRQLAAAQAAGLRAHGLCIVADAETVLDELLPEVAAGAVISLDTSHASAVAECRTRGLIVCVRLDENTPAVPAEFTAAAYVWLEGSRDAGLRPLAKLAQRLPGRRIAGSIGDRGQFADAKENGAILFEGDWYERVQSSARAVTPAQATVLELIQLVGEEAPIGRIEPLLKRDATLSFRLLRYINSAGFGLSCEIQSFKHAVSILGYQNLARWLSLVLATAGSTPAAQVLLREAATRGRLMELLGEACGSTNDRDNLFIVGVFSMLPAILQVPMTDLVEQIHLPDAITDALVDRSGLYGPILRLAEQLERDALPTQHHFAADLQLSGAQVSRFHLQAMAWAEQITA